MFSVPRVCTPPSRPSSLQGMPNLTCVLDSCNSQPALLHRATWCSLDHAMGLSEQSENTETDQLKHAASDTLPLLQLPSPILFSILQRLDVTDLCSVSRACCLLSKIAAHNSLWPSFKHDGWATWDVRCTLARRLHVPPQVFHVQLDVKRSRKFPITVPLHNLRPILSITDTEGLADRLSKAVQDQVSKLSATLWRLPSWQQYPPAASISSCRADRATVRASLRPEAVVPLLLHQLQQAGWPPQAAACNTAAPACSCTGHRGTTGSNWGWIWKNKLAARLSSISASSCMPTLGTGSSNCVMWAEVPASVQGASEGMPGWQYSLSSSSVAGLMMECLQECHTRLVLLAAGQLPQLDSLACSGASSGSMPRRASSPGSGEPRERLAALQLAKPVPWRVAEATARRLPDWEAAKTAAVGQLMSLSLTQPAAEQLAPAAVGLLYLGAAADPSEVTFSLPGKPGWVLALQKVCKALYRLHQLQQVCCCTEDVLQQQDSNGKVQVGAHAGQAVLPVRHQLLLPPEQLSAVLAACSSCMQGAWSAAAGAELQLCLAGLQEFPRAVSSSKCSPATLFKCLMSLEAAATEYAAAYEHQAGVLAANEIHQQKKGSMKHILQVSEGVLGSSELPASQELVRCAMHIETLRSMLWVVWLLGCGPSHVCCSGCIND